MYADQQAFELTAEAKQINVERSLISLSLGIILI